MGGLAWRHAAKTGGFIADFLHFQLLSEHPYPTAEEQDSHGGRGPGRPPFGHLRKMGVTHIGKCQRIVADMGRKTEAQVTRMEVKQGKHHAQDECRYTLH